MPLPSSLASPQDCKAAWCPAVWHPALLWQQHLPGTAQEVEELLLVLLSSNASQLAIVARSDFLMPSVWLAGPSAAAHLLHWVLVSGSS